MNTFKEVAVNERSISKRKLIHGVGINDANYVTNPRVNGKQIRCPYYHRWINLLERGYSKSYRGNSYKVCEEWLTFSNFKLWMKEQDWEGKTLNVGLKGRNNKVFSPDTSLFISESIVAFIRCFDAVQERHLIGTHFDKASGKFRSSCRTREGKVKQLGYYKTPEEAHMAWREYKKKVGYAILEEQDNPEIKEAFIKYVDEL